MDSIQIQSRSDGGTKICGKCKKYKKFSEFNKDKYTKSGFRSQCKSCMTSQRRELKDYYKNWRDENKDFYRQYRKDNYDKVKAKARNDCQKLKKGRCEICGTNENIEAHHDDYSKPLDVRWLCRRHHIEWHMKNDQVISSKPNDQIKHNPITTDTSR